MTDSGLGSETPSATERRTRITPRKGGDESYSQIRKLEEKVARRESRITLLRSQLDQVKKREIMLVKEVQRTRELAADSASATSNQFEKMKASLSATHDRERVLRDQLEVARSMASLSCASSIAPSPDPLKHSPMASFREREMDHDRIRNLESQLANQKLKTREAEAKLQNQRTAPITPPVTAVAPPVHGVVTKGDFFIKLRQHSAVVPDAVDFLSKVTEGDPDDAPLEYETLLTEIATNWNDLGEKTTTTAATTTTPTAPTDNDIKAYIIQSLTDQGVSTDILTAAENCSSVSELLQMLSYNKRTGTEVDTTRAMEVLLSNGVSEGAVNTLKGLSGDAFFEAIAKMMQSPPTKTSLLEAARSKGLPEHLLTAVEHSSVDETICIEQVLSKISETTPAGHSTETCVSTLTQHNVCDAIVSSIHSTEHNTVDIHQTLIKLSSVITELQSGTTEYVNRTVLLEKAKERGIADEHLTGIAAATEEAINAVDLLGRANSCDKTGLQRSLHGKVSDGVLAEIDQLSEDISYEDVIVKLATLVDISSNTTVTSWPNPEHNNDSAGVQDNPPETAKNSLEHETRNIIDGVWIRAYDPSSLNFYYMCVDGSQENTWYCPPEFDINRAVLQEEMAVEPEAVVQQEEATAQLDVDESSWNVDEGPEGGESQPLQPDGMEREATDPQVDTHHHHHHHQEEDIAREPTDPQGQPQGKVMATVGDVEGLGEHDEGHGDYIEQQPLEGVHHPDPEQADDGPEVRDYIDPEGGTDHGYEGGEGGVEAVEAVTNAVIDQPVEGIHEEPLPQDDYVQQPPPSFDAPTDEEGTSMCSDGQHAEDEEVTWPVGTKARLESVQETIRSLLPPGVTELEFFGKPPETIEAKEARLMASSPDPRKSAPTISQDALVSGMAELSIGADMFQFD